MPSRHTHLECTRCGDTLDPDRLWTRCGCGGHLDARYDFTDLDLDAVRRRQSGMWRYAELLPVRGEPVRLGEPETPLLACPSLSRRWDVELMLKDEGALVGGTFKARGAAVGVSRAVELGASGLVYPSAGNAGGAWAAYGARAGLPVTVVMPRNAPRANRTEVRLAGAELVLVDGTLTDAGRTAAEIAARTGHVPAASFAEPYRVDGKKTAFLETFDRLGQLEGPMRFPRTIIVPVGGGVGALAAMKAADEALAAGWAAGEPPRVVGVQPETCAPIAHALRTGAGEVVAWTGSQQTLAAGLRVPGPAMGTLVLRRFRETGGELVTVGDGEILDAVRDLASGEGVLACPEGAATVAAAGKLAAQGRLEGPVLLYNTGSALKYLDDLAAAADVGTGH